ncbi:MAG: molybdopterin synthase catalytic subunit MoaE [Oceanobacter sp.]
MSTYIQVQSADFSIAEEYDRLRDGNLADGGIVFFTGLVRDRNLGDSVTGLYLEHYPGMTEQALESIVQQARERWPINRVSVMHRVGQLDLGDQIVFVGTTSPHRQAAFEACEFIMDYLKSQAPFWKKETYRVESATGQGQESGRWIEPRDIDTQAMHRWDNSNLDKEAEK